MSPVEKLTILVVDDDAMVRSVVRGVLVRRGYRVLEADGIEGALNACRQEDVALAVVDYHMPLALGPEVVAALRQVRPGVRVVYMTGSRGVALPGIGDEVLLRKPFDAGELVRAVEGLIAPVAGRD